MKLILNFRGIVNQIAPDRIEVNLPGNANGIQLFNEVGFQQLQKVFLLSNEQMGQLGDRVYENALAIALKESIQVIIVQPAPKQEAPIKAERPINF